MVEMNLDLAEPLGFQSIWGVEHHFTDYTMCPDVLQFLTYMAGRTTRAELGSMVVVLPWHDPMRVAEEVSMLDHISSGRLILGLGRGAGKVVESPCPTCRGAGRIKQHKTLSVKIPSSHSFNHYPNYEVCRSGFGRGKSTEYQHTETNRF